MKNIETILKDNGIELTAEQLKAISKEVVDNYKTKAEYDNQSTKLTKAQTDLTKAQDDIKNISTTYEEKTAEEWKAELDRVNGEWEIEKKNREEQVRISTLEQMIENVFPTDKKFTSDYVRRGIIEDMKAEIGKAENQGKGYAEIFASLTTDKEGIFQNAHEGTPPPPPTAGGSSTPTDFSKMTYTQLCEFLNNNPNTKLE